MGDTTVAEKAAVLRKEAVARLTAIIEPLYANTGTDYSGTEKQINRVVECIVSAAMLEVTDVFRQGLKEGADTGGRSCNCHKS